MLLTQILKAKKEEIKQRKKTLPLNELKKRLGNIKPSRDFITALKKPNKVSIIAEIKKASPYKGIIKKHFSPLLLARECVKGGAAALSILTDEKFFQGNINFLSEISKNINIPILRKDFIIDAYQIYESKYYGADAILLIAEILSFNQLQKFIKIAKILKLNYIVEIHETKNLEKVLKLKPPIIGINNRNLKTGTTNLKTSQKLISSITKNFPFNSRPLIISESGIKNKKDLKFLKNLCVDAVLIGEGIMRSKNPAQKIKELTIQ